MANHASNAQSESAQEEWRAVVGWEGLYEVSDLGRVRSVDRILFTPSPPRGPYFRKYKGKVLKQNVGTDGRYHVVLSCRDRRETPVVSRLVCLAFHGEPGEKKDAAHNDGNRLNNRAGNLRWATRKENMADTLAHGTRNRGERHGLAKLTAENVREIRASGETLGVLGARFGVSFQTISDIRCRNSWRHI